jgi:hypothetical protein
MCRSIKQLRNDDTQPGEEEINAAALQFVRKVSGYRKPSRRNQEAFELAVVEISQATHKLLESINTRSVQNGHHASHQEGF